MRLWRSVVGKLWMTILFLVAFVLFLLTILLLEFFGDYHVKQIEGDLLETAQKVSYLIEAHPEKEIGKEIAFEIVEHPTNLIVAYDQNTFNYSPHKKEKDGVDANFLLSDSDLANVFYEGEVVTKEVSVKKGANENKRGSNIIITGVPLKADKDKQGGVFIYQSLGVLKETTKQTTKLIVLAAGIAIILTTFFAFFLSTRITAPLRKMREAAFSVAKGKFDTKVPILTNDEIGELATAFNQMGRQLKFNISALNQEKEHLTSILSSMADGVITFNRDGTILITNPPAELFLQQWYFEKENKNDTFVPKEMIQLLDKVFHTESEQIGELKVQGRSYVVIATPLYNQDRIRGAVAVVRDMTEERRLDKLRIDFVSNVSHELRTPIAMLQGYSEAMIDDMATTEEEMKEMAKIIYDESLRMGRLVNELLDLARMESGHAVLEKEKVPIDAYLERITTKFQGLATDNNVHLVYNPSNNAHDYVYMDSDKIEQVLTNLIDNAIRHTAEDGTVTVSYNMKADNITISVTDNGAGIPEEDLPFVFERFYKADKARTRGRSGTGLGLAIAKNIIETHNGKISVQSKEGHGTTFSFRLPKALENKQKRDE